MTKIPGWHQKYLQKRQKGMPANPGTSSPAPDFSRKLNGPMPTQSGEGDISHLLATRVQQKAAELASGGGSNGYTADLVEGFPYYTKLQAEPFGHVVSLFRTAGTISGPTARGVQVKGEINGYLIDGINAVDMSKIKDRNDLQVALVEVSVPFMGTFLVPKEAVVKKGSGPTGDGRKLLKG
jgi:hypothetical protein